MESLIRLCSYQDYQVEKKEIEKNVSCVEIKFTENIRPMAMIVHVCRNWRSREFRLDSKTPVPLHFPLRNAGIAGRRAKKLAQLSGNSHDIRSRAESRTNLPIPVPRVTRLLRAATPAN